MNCCLSNTVVDVDCSDLSTYSCSFSDVRFQAREGGVRLNTAS